MIGLFLFLNFQNSINIWLLRFILWYKSWYRIKEPLSKLKLKKLQISHCNYLTKALTDNLKYHMKKLLLTLTLLFSFAGFAQTINGIPIQNLDVEYLQIIGSSVYMSSKVKISIDIGQRTKLMSSNNDTARLKDKNGEVLVFNSIIDALNFMAGYGYEFVQSNILVEGGQNVFYYLMKKKSK